MTCEGRLRSHLRELADEANSDDRQSGDRVTCCLELSSAPSLLLYRALLPSINSLRQGYDRLPMYVPVSDNHWARGEHGCRAHIRLRVAARDGPSEDDRVNRSVGWSLSRAANLRGTL